MESVQVLFQTFNLSLGNFTFSPSFIQAGAVVLLLFFLLIVLATMRRHFIDWSFKGALFGLFFGFLLALILEGFLIIGGRTAITEILGWENAPKPLVNAIDVGREKLVNVLGVSEEIPYSVAKENPTMDDAIEVFQGLSPEDSRRVKSLICVP